MMARAKDVNSAPSFGFMFEDMVKNAVRDMLGREEVALHGRINGRVDDAGILDGQVHATVCLEVF